MSIFSKLFRKGQPKVEAEAPEEVFEDTFIDETEAGTYETYGDSPFTYVPVEDVDVDINYRGGLLSPTQKPKEEQYQEFLDNITEETIAVIDKALKEEEHLYDVFRRIEEQDISLLTLVALDMTSEEDIAAYQLKQQRQYEDDGALVEDEEYAREVEQAQVQQPHTQFQVDLEGLEELDVISATVNKNYEPALEPLVEDATPVVVPTTVPLIDDSMSVMQVEAMPISPPQDTSIPVVDSVVDIATEDEAPPIFSGSIFGTPLDEVKDVTEVKETEPPVETPPPVFPRSSPSANKMLGALLAVDKPVEPTPVSLPAKQFMSDMQPIEESAPVVAVSETPPNTDVPVKATQEALEPISELPANHELPKPTFLQEMEQVEDEVKPPVATEPVTEKSEELQEKAGTFAGVKMEFEGYEDKSAVEEAGKPHDVLDGLRALFSPSSTRNSRNRVPKLTTPSLSDEKVEEKAQHIQKYQRKTTIKDTRIYILWDGLTLPKVEGYQFIGVKNLRDLSSFGLDVNDLLIVTSQIPSGFVDSIDAYLHNIREEQQPYRIVNFAKKPYETPYVTESLNALTKEALDIYFENNQIVLDKKNQVSGFGGIADFLTKKGEDN